jgi:hypothetical protein
VIREAKTKDIPKIIELGIESLTINDPYPELRIDKQKVRQMAIELVSGASNFAWVYENDDGEVVGAVCGLMHEIMFHERKQLSVVMYYCREPGGGGFLMRKLVRWWKTRPGYKMCVVSLEEGSDPRIGRILMKAGLNKQIPTYAGVQ